MPYSINSRRGWVQEPHGEWLPERTYCEECGDETLPGETLCEECAMKAREAMEATEDAD